MPIDLMRGPDLSLGDFRIKLFALCLLPGALHDVLGNILLGVLNLRLPGATSVAVLELSCQDIEELADFRFVNDQKEGRNNRPRDRLKNCCDARNRGRSGCGQSQMPLTKATA